MEKKMNQNDEFYTKADEILKKPYARQIVPEEDGSFRGEILEFPGCLALGDTTVEALTSLENVARDWLESALRNGQSIPEPIETNAERLSKEGREYVKTR
jgi:predicted RNase H-like HicB family nuclease